MGKDELKAQVLCSTAEWILNLKRPLLFCTLETIMTSAGPDAPSEKDGGTGFVRK